MKWWVACFVVLAFFVAQPAPATADAPAPEADPSHGKIVFVLDGDIHVVDPDGSGPTRLTQTGRDQWPAWSPDGDRIAFTRGDFPDPDLYVMEADGSQPTRLTGGSQPAWSPDGTQIAFTGADGIYVMEADGSNVTQLTTNDPNFFSDADAAWSPDGGRIAFARWFSTPVVYSMAPDGTDLQELHQYGFHPAWSSEGETIVFARFLRLCQGALWAMDADGGNSRELVKDPADCDLARPSYSPDGEEIVFEALPMHPQDPRVPPGVEPLPAGLYIVDQDGSNRRFLTEGSQPDWQAVPDGDPPPQPPPADTSAACPEGPVPAAGFGDIAGNTHEHTIECVAWWGLARGVSATEYAPRRTVNRAQMATFVAGLIRESGGTLPPPSDQGFTDVGGTHADSINQLAAAGVVSGTTATTYAPERPVRRDQMTTFLVGAYRHVTGTQLEAEHSYFDDIAGSVHRDNIDAAAAAGFTSGTGPRRFSPTDSVRRDQMATFLARTLNRLVDEEVASPPGA